jgi:hypothetical protein
MFKMQQPKKVAMLAFKFGRLANAMHMKVSDKEERTKLPIGDIDGLKIVAIEMAIDIL